MLLIFCERRLPCRPPPPSSMKQVLYDEAVDVDVDADVDVDDVDVDVDVDDGGEQERQASSPFKGSRRIHAPSFCSFSSHWSSPTAPILVRRPPSSCVVPFLPHLVRRPLPASFFRFLYLRLLPPILVRRPLSASPGVVLPTLLFLSPLPCSHFLPCSSYCYEGACRCPRFLTRTHG